MKIYNLLSIFLLLCLSAKAQEEPITETEALSALQEVLSTLNKYKLITDGNEWFLAEQEAVSAINKHNRTAMAHNKIISDISYKRNHHLILGLPPDPYKVYGDKWFDMKESIWFDMKESIATFRPRSNQQLTGRGNKVFKDGVWRFLTEQEAISAINDHNRTALAQNKIISTTSYHKNYRLIPGLSSYGKYDSKILRSQIIDWKKSPTLGNKVFKDGVWRFLTEQEAISAINDHNRTALAQNKIISQTSYLDNYRLIPGLPNNMHKYNLESLISQIIDWKGLTEKNRGNKVFRDGVWRFLTEQEAISAINDHNQTALAQNKIISTTSYRDNYGLIPGLSSRYAFINNNRITSQIIGWEGYSAEPRHRGNKVFRNGRWLFLTEQESVSAINDHNRTTTSVQNKIISLMSYQENYGLIPGLPPTPWTHYGLTTWKEMLKEIQFDHYNYNNMDRVCSAQFTIP